MKEWQIAILVKPLLVIGLLVFVVIPIETAFIRWFPEGRLKRLMLTRW